MSKLKKVLIALGILVLASLGYENKEAVVGGFNTMRGFATLPSADINSVLVTLSSSSFVQLATTSLELVPAPGVGKIVNVLSVSGYRVFSSESWNNQSANAPAVGFSGGAAITASLSKGLFSGPSGGTVASPSYQTLYSVDSIVASNSAVVLRRIGATKPTIDGDTYFRFFVLYRIINLP